MDIILPVAVLAAFPLGWAAHFTRAWIRHRYGI